MESPSNEDLGFSGQWVSRPPQRWKTNDNCLNQGDKVKILGTLMCSWR